MGHIYFAMFLAHDNTAHAQFSCHMTNNPGTRNPQLVPETQDKNHCISYPLHMFDPSVTLIGWVELTILLQISQITCRHLRDYVLKLSEKMGTDVFEMAEVAMKDDIINSPKYKLLDSTLAGIMQYSKYRLPSKNTNTTRVESQQSISHNSPTLSKLLLG